MYMYTHTHACMHVRTYVRMHARTHACMHARTHAHTHARTNARAHTHTHTQNKLDEALGSLSTVSGHRADQLSFVALLIYKLSTLQMLVGRAHR